MTTREMRLLRLLRLRERQHDLAALHLRAARMQLAAAESAATDARHRNRAAHGSRLAAVSQGDAGEWMLACAESHVASLTAGAQQAQLARAKVMADKAAEIEMAARRERKQMEATLALMHRESARQAARAEQGTLDEIARLQRTRSTPHPFRGRDL